MRSEPTTSLQYNVVLINNNQQTFINFIYLVKVRAYYYYKNKHVVNHCET